MYLALAYLCLIIACYLYALKNNRGLGFAGVVVIGVYLISTVAAMVLIFLDDVKLMPVPTLYFAGILMLFMLPHISSNRIQEQASAASPWTSLHSFFAFTVMVPCYYSIAYSLPAAVRNLNGSIETTRILVYSGENIGTGNLNTTLASGFWPLSLGFAVYAALARRSIILIACLTFASTAGAISGLASLGRSGMVYWILYLLIWLALTWPMIKLRMGKKIRYLKSGVVTAVLLVAVGVVFLAYRRNLGSGNMDKGEGLNSRAEQVVYSLSSYTGQSLLNFQDFWLINDDFGRNLCGQKSFPIYFGLMERLGIVDDYDAKAINIIYKAVYDESHLEHAVFNGFQRELVMDFGKVGTMLVGILYFFVSSFAKRRYESRFSFSRVLFSSFLISVPVFGIFFFAYGDFWGNIAMPAIMIVCGVFTIEERGA